MRACSPRELGYAIEIVRYSADMTLDDLANVTSIPKELLRAYEKGRAQFIRFDQLEQILAACSWTLLEFAALFEVAEEDSEETPDPEELPEDERTL